MEKSEVVSFFKKTIKSQKHQDRAISLLDKAFSYITLDAEESDREVRSREFQEKKKSLLAERAKLELERAKQQTTKAKKAASL